MSEARIALVSGGNRGLGLETCRQLARQGVRVLLGSRDVKKGQVSAEGLATMGVDVEVLQLDVTSADDVRIAQAYIQTTYGRLDILVNNAAILIDHGGLGGSSGSVGAIDTSIGDLEATISANIVGSYRLNQTFVPMMVEQNYGRIVHYSSGMGQLSDMNGGYPAYRLSKTAVNVWTRNLAWDLRQYNIKVNSLCPGWVRTDMGGRNAARSVEEGADTAVWLATLDDDGPTGCFFRNRKEIPW